MNSNNQGQSLLYSRFFTLEVNYHLEDRLKVLLKHLTPRERRYFLMRKDNLGNTFFQKIAYSEPSELRCFLNVFHKENCLLAILKEKNKKGQFPMNLIMNNHTWIKTLSVLDCIFEYFIYLNRNEIIDLFMMKYPGSQGKVLFQKAQENLKDFIVDKIEEAHPGIVNEICNKIAQKRDVEQANLKEKGNAKKIIRHKYNLR